MGTGFSGRMQESTKAMSLSSTRRRKLIRKLQRMHGKSWKQEYVEHVADKYTADRELQFWQWYGMKFGTPFANNTSNNQL